MILFAELSRLTFNAIGIQLQAISSLRLIAECFSLRVLLQFGTAQSDESASQVDRDGYSWLENWH